jgi:hypothetical protein
MLRQYCPGLTVTSTQTASLPDMAAADENYIVPVLGRTIYDLITPEDLSAAPIRGTLRDFCRRVVAPFALRDNLAVKQVQIGDTGIHSVTTETLTPAPRWAFLKLEDDLTSRGMSALEKLWGFLYDNATELAWSSPVAKTFFTTGLDFSKAYTLQRPHTVFTYLLPIIAEIEDQYIFGKIGEEFAIELRDKSILTDDEKAVLKRLRMAIANLVISTATTKLATKITKEGFTVLSGDSGDQPSKGEGDSSWTMKQDLKTKTETDGLTFLTEAVEYLNKNASATVFKKYFESTFYTKPVTTKPEDPNAYRKTFFAL